MSMVASVLVIVVRWATQDRCPAAMTIEFRQTRHYATPQPLRMRPTDGLGRPLRLLDSSEWIKGCRGPLRVIRDRGRVSSKSGYVRSAPKATELLRRHEMTRWARSRPTRRA
jgi:hypothetical protein